MVISGEYQSPIWDTHSIKYINFTNFPRVDILWKRTTSSESSITLWKLSVSIKWNLGIFCSGGNGQHLTAMMCWTWSFFFSFVSFVWVTLIFSLVPHFFSLILTLLLMTASSYMSHMGFRTNLHSVVACMPRNSLLETGVLSEF